MNTLMMVTRKMPPTTQLLILFAFLCFDSPLRSNLPLNIKETPMATCSISEITIKVTTKWKVLLPLLYSTVYLNWLAFAVIKAMSIIPVEAEENKILIFTSKSSSKILLNQNIFYSRKQKKSCGIINRREQKMLFFPDRPNFLRNHLANDCISSQFH